MEISNIGQAESTGSRKMFSSPEPRRALKPDAQAFDEVRIITVPRYKMSGLSGDERR